MHKRKNKKESIPKKKILKTQGVDSQLYYIARNDCLLKDLTLSFYNSETKKKMKQILIQKVGQVNQKTKNTNITEHQQQKNINKQQHNNINISNIEGLKGFQTELISKLCKSMQKVSLKSQKSPKANHTMKVKQILHQKIHLKK